MAAVDEEVYDVVVVGAGVAGGALATVLARDGRSVLCIERSLKQPERIVGELLQPGGYEMLCDLGLRDALEGIDAQRVYGYGIFLDDRRMSIDYTPPTSSAQSDSKRHSGRSFHNGRFIRRLRELLAEETLATLREGNVTSLYEVDGAVRGVRYTDPSSRTQHTALGRMTIACDGCFSRLRKMVSPAAEFAVMSQFYGLILRSLSLPYPEHGHVILAEPAPLLFYPISSTEVRCLVDAPSFVASAEGWRIERFLLEQILPQLPNELRDAFRQAVEDGEIKSMPNRIMPASPTAMRGAILLGDSFNMRHPLTGGGMTVALNDVRHIRDLLRTVPELDDYAAVAAQQKSFYDGRRSFSSTINILANALYGVFCASGDAAMKDMREACFDYLCKDGRFSEDPIGMLGGLKPYPYLLMCHFFAVAVYGCGRVLLPFPTPARLAKSWSLFRSAFNIIKPLIDAEGVTVLSKVPISHL